MSAPLRVLHVATYVHPDQFGGAERVIHGVAEAAARAGHDVTVLTGRHDPAHAAEERRDGCRILRYPMPRAARGAAFLLAVRSGVARALAALAASGRFDVVHAHQVASAGPALRARSLARARVYSFYAPYHEEFAVERSARAGAQRLGLVDRVRRGVALRLDRDCVRRADRVVVLSEFSRGQLRALDPDRASAAARVPPGVDCARFCPGDAAAARRSLGLDDSGLLIATVRRLVRRMGLDDALAAAAALGGRHGGAHLAIAGAGPEREHLEALARELGLGGRVTFLGRIADERLPDLYRAADLFLLPTRALEGFGMVTLEALACGTPVLATAVGANPEVLGELLPELPVVAGGAPALTAGIAAALDRRVDLRAAAARAAATLARDWSWDACAARLEQIYRDAGSTEAAP